MMSRTDFLFRCTNVFRLTLLVRHYFGFPAVLGNLKTPHQVRSASDG